MFNFQLTDMKLFQVYWQNKFQYILMSDTLLGSKSALSFIRHSLLHWDGPIRGFKIQKMQTMLLHVRIRHIKKHFDGSLSRIHPCTVIARALADVVIIKSFTSRPLLNQKWLCNIVLLVLMPRHYVVKVSTAAGVV